MSDLLRQVTRLDAQLGEDLAREVEVLARRRPFGLNFERHLPEAVDLPGRPVRRGDKVRFLPERGAVDTVDRDIWVVASVTRTDEGRVATLVRRAAPDADPETATRAVDDLVVVAESQDPIYPGLVSTGRVERGGDSPCHTVINAENLHALQTLLYTHEGRIDAIYIDPPYNTGNEGWIYSDRYVAGDDAYKHSKWLAFMERRLLLAQRLLKPTGVIIVAIGDEEHHRLRMLMDQVFGVQNFLGNVVWAGSIKGDARYIGGGVDYMLLYARDEASLAENGVVWRERKEGMQDLLDAGARAWEESGHDAEIASRLLSGWWSKNVHRYDPGLGDNVKVDADGSLFKVENLVSPNPRPNLQYDLLHPVTGKPVRMNPNGWRYSREAMDELVADGRILFGKDHTAGARKKTPLSAMSMQGIRPVFQRDRRAASKYLQRTLADKRFPYPKDHEVLMRWLRIVAPKDAVILDFFGGSGSTAEAVMRLNAEDGGTRQSLLVTNNEVASADAKRLRKAGHRKGDPEWEALGVFEHVARPRITTVATGVRPDGSTYSDGLDADVEFFTLTYEAPRQVAHHRSFEAIAPLLWLRAGARGRRIDKPTADFDVADAYGVLFDLDHTHDFLAAVGESDGVRMVFVVTEDDRAYQSVCAELPPHVEAVRLYSSYLTSFTLGVGVDR